MLGEDSYNIMPKGWINNFCCKSGKTTFIKAKNLLIDTDPQGNVSTYLNFDKNSKEA